MKKLIVIGLIIYSIVMLTSCGNSCKGHEEIIKNSRINKAEKMGMTVENISVEYIGDCQYRCVSHIYDPGTIYSAPQVIRSRDIYQWEDNNYIFVRSE